MSIVVLKRKSLRRPISGTSPGGVWESKEFGGRGFSLNGGMRKLSVNRDMMVSKSGTPFKGIYPKGYGGNHGQYKSSYLFYPNSYQSGNAPSLLNISFAATNEPLFIKPSVLSYKGMVRNRTKQCAQYPHYWVQPNYTGNLTDNNSQQLYIEQKHTQHLSTNNNNTILPTPSTCCHPHHKNTQTIDSHTHQQSLKQTCLNPTTPSFPYKVSTGRNIGAAGTSVTSSGNSCGTSRNILLRTPYH